MKFLALFFLLFAWHSFAQTENTSLAVVTEIVDEYTIKAISVSSDWVINQHYPVISKSPPYDLIAYVHLIKIENISDTDKRLIFKISRHSKKYFLPVGAYIKRLELLEKSNLYKGNTDLIITDRREVSSRYKPLVNQGYQIGDTAQTLNQGEYLVNFLGFTSFAPTEYWTVTAPLPTYLLGAFKVDNKIRFYNENSHILSFGLGAYDIPNPTYDSSDSQSHKRFRGANLSFYWDSIAGDNQVTHTSISLYSLDWDYEKEETAFKILSKSEIRIGYEFIMSNWDRLLVGPSFDIKQKIIGGNLGYAMIWDHFHMIPSLYIQNLTLMKFGDRDNNLSPVNLDMYWRW